MENISKSFWDVINENKDKTFGIEPMIVEGELKQQKKITYRDLINASAMLREEVGTANFDQCIGIFIENRIEFLIAFISGIFNGFTIVGIDPKASDEELKRIIEENRLQIIFTVRECYRRFENKVNYIINIDEIGDYSNNEKYFSIIQGNLDDIMVISYTSGTSGEFPKGVKLSFENISFVSEQYKKIYSLKNTSKIITVLPLWHNYAMFACLTSAMVSGAELLIMNGWDVQTFIKINELYKPDIFPGSPYMYIDIIKQDLDHIDISLKICDSGGDSLPIECIKRFEEKTNSIITEGYGLTETSSLTHFNFSAKDRKIGSIGKVVDNVECMIKDLHGNEVSAGNWGLLWIKGSVVFKGYVNNDKLTNDVVKNGWFNTNDVVKVDENGYYYIAGRLSDLQHLDNMQVSLRDIENILYKFEDIKRVFIKKERNHEARFDFFDLYVVLKENADQTKLYDYIKQNLNKVIINEVKFVSELPVTGTGKVKRKQIKEKYENGTL